MPNPNSGLQTCTIPDASGYAYLVAYEKGGKWVKDTSERCLSPEELESAKERKDIEGLGCPDDSRGRFETQPGGEDHDILVLRCVVYSPRLRFRMEQGAQVFLAERSRPSWVPGELDKGEQSRNLGISTEWKSSFVSYVAVGAEYQVHPLVSFFGQALTGYYSIPGSQKSYFQLGAAAGAAIGGKNFPLYAELGLKAVGLIPSIVPADAGCAVGAFVAFGLRLNDFLSLKLSVPFAESAKIGGQDFPKPSIGAGLGVGGSF